MDHGVDRERCGNGEFFAASKELLRSQNIPSHISHCRMWLVGDSLSWHQGHCPLFLEQAAVVEVLQEVPDASEELW